MSSSTTPSLARRALMLVSLLAAAGCVTYATRGRDQAASPPLPNDPNAPDDPKRVVEPLRAAAALACPKPAGADKAVVASEGNPAARAGAQKGLGFVAREAIAWQ